MHRQHAEHADNTAPLHWRQWQLPLPALPCEANGGGTLCVSPQPLRNIGVIRIAVIQSVVQSVVVSRSKLMHLCSCLVLARLFWAG